MQQVVGAVIVDSLTVPTTVLAARRTRPAHLAGKWEFPGGKVEPGETPERALAREIREELAVTIEVGGELSSPSGAWPISERYELRLYLALLTAGVPGSGTDHDEVRWLSAGELGSVDWLPSDLQALPSLRRLLGETG